MLSEDELTQLPRSLGLTHQHSVSLSWEMIENAGARFKESNPRHERYLVKCKAF